MIKHAQYFLEYVMARFFFGVMSFMPRPVGVGFGRWLGRSIGKILTSRKKVAFQNMKIAFPESTEAQRQEWLDQCWENLGQSLWEFSRVPGMSREAYYSQMQVQGLEHIKESHAKGKGIIFVTAHYANWELATQWAPFEGYPLAVIARRMKNPFMDRFITNMRSQQGTRVFVHRQAVRESIRWLKQGHCLGMLIDQRITAGGAQIPFFGQPVHTTTMPAILALRLGTPIHTAHCYRDGDKMRLVIDPALDLSGLTNCEADIGEAMKKMNQILEQWIREYPPLWLWIHNRWKI